MASYTVAEAKHGTFTGTTADLVTFDIAWQVVRIVNKDTADVVYFKVNTSTAPTAAAADTHIVRPGEAVVYASKAPVKSVYLVGDGGDYAVEGFPGFGSSASSGGGSSGGAVTNAGTFAVQDSQVITDDAAFTPATSKVFPIGLQADETATDSVDEGDAGAPRMTLDRKQIVTPQPHTQGGVSTIMFTGSDGAGGVLVATKQTVKASAGQLYGYYIYNPNAAATFVHIYNTDTVTVGTTNPQVTLTIPAASAANLAFTHGVAFSTAMSMAATTTAGGNTAPSTGLDVIIWYM